MNEEYKYVSEIEFRESETGGDYYIDGVRAFSLKDILTVEEAYNRGEWIDGIYHPVIGALKIKYYNEAGEAEYMAITHNDEIVFKHTFHPKLNRIEEYKKLSMFK